MKIGFTAGAFDLCHVGHVRMFKDCKEVCDFLIVALQSDPTIDKEYRPNENKAIKNKPIQDVGERLEMLESIKWIDEIVHYDTEEGLYNLLQGISIDIRIIGDDWKDKKFTGHDLPIKMYYHSRSGHIYSTSHLRDRIINAELEKQKNK